MKILAVLTLTLALSLAAVAQTQAPAEAAPNQAAPAYTPKFPGDPAHSDGEAIALGYMRTVAAAQQVYRKKHGDYARSLRELVGNGSFTRRMADPNQPGYKAEFYSNGKQWSIRMIPDTYDAEHRAFYMNETGTIRSEADKPATANSAVIEKG